MGTIASGLRKFLQVEMDENSGIFVVLQAHGAIILIIVQVLKQGDPLLVHVKATTQDNRLGNRYGAYTDLLRAECFRYNLNHLSARCMWRDRNLDGDCRACFLENKHIQKFSIQENVESDLIIRDRGHSFLKNDVFDMDRKL